MPGVVGCVSNKGVHPDLVTAMIHPMMHRPFYRVQTSVVGPFAFGVINWPAGGPIGSPIATDGRYNLAFYGALYEEWIDRGRDIAAQLLKRWNQGGAKALCDLNGEYLIVVWDSKDEALTIVNDRLGLKRLNYWQGNGTFAFASEVKSLAVNPEVSRTIDEHALSELLTFGHLQDDRTLLRDVKLLPHASCLMWKDGKVEVRRYWDYVFKVDPKFQNFDRAVDEYFDVVRQATERRIQGYERIGLFLSGGLDSRTIGGMVRKVRPEAKLFTWTAGHGHDHDSRFAKQIARAIQSEHTTIRIPENFLEEYGPHYAWVLDGTVTSHGSHRACLFEDAYQNSDIVLLGYMGDTVSGGKPLDKVYQITDLDELSEKGYGFYAVGFDDQLFQRVLKPSVFDQIKGFAFQRFRESVKHAEVEFLGDRVVYAELVQRQRLYTSTAQMDLQGIDGYWGTPFSDKHFIDFSLRLPMKFRLYKEAYIGMIRKYFPTLARISRSGDGLPLVHSRFRESLHWRWVLFQRNTLPKLTGGRLGGHNYGAFVHCAEWFRRASGAFIERTLIDNPLLEEHFQMDRLNQLVRDFLEDCSERDLMECVASLMMYALFRGELERLSVFSERKKEILCVGL